MLKVVIACYKSTEIVKSRAVEISVCECVMKVVNDICPARDNACLLIQEDAVNGHVYFKFSSSGTSSGQLFFWASKFNFLFHSCFAHYGIQVSNCQK
jgi:hypothetical protein